MSTKDILMPAEVHDVIVGRVQAVKSRMIDQRTDIDSILKDLLSVVQPEPPSPPKGGLGILKSFLTVLVAAVASLSVSANYPFKDSAMATKTVAKNKHDAAGYLVAAREAQISRKWSDAAALYEQAFDCGTGPECSLGREAECLFYAGRIPEAIEVLGRMDKLTHGESPTVPYLRGLMAFGEKDMETARKQFQMAEMAGDRRATLMLKRIP